MKAQTMSQQQLSPRQDGQALNVVISASGMAGYTLIGSKMFVDTLRA